MHRWVNSGRWVTDRPFKVMLLSALLLLGVAHVDHLTGVELGFSIFYLLPVALAAWFVGLNAGLLTAGAAAVLWFVMDSVLGHQSYSNPGAPYWNTMVRLGFFVIVTVITARLHHSIEATKAHANELFAAHAELDRVQKEQLLIKDQVLSHVSHELRTPLTAVHQFITILLDGLAGELTTEQREYLQIALKNTDQLNRMIEDLLDTTRLDSSRLRFSIQETAVAGLVQEILRTFRSAASAKSISLTATGTEGMPHIAADPGRIRQVLLNLVDNAIKFTPEHGAVNIGVRRYEEDEGLVCFSISDTGAGVSREDQSRLFRRLSQIENGNAASRKGLGLGLYICKEIILRHNGKIWVESTPGKGSVFSFTVPITGSQKAEASGVREEVAHEKQDSHN